MTDAVLRSSVQRELPAHQQVRKGRRNEGKSQGMGAVRFCERASGWAAAADSSDHGKYRYIRELHGQYLGGECAAT